MSATSGPNIVSDGLVLCLDAANKDSYPGSGTTWYDVSGNGNDGTFINSTTFEATSIGGVIMDGGDEYLRIPPSSNLTEYFSTNSFSVQTLIRSDNVVYPRSRHPFYVNGTVTSVSTPGWSVGHTSAATYIQVISGDGTNRQISNINHNVSESTIYHRIFTVDRSSGTLTKYYVNGVYIGQANHTTVTGSIYDGSTTDFQTGLVFGYVWGWRYIGAIFNISVYSKILSPSEVKQNYDSIKTRFGLT